MISECGLYFWVCEQPDACLDKFLDLLYECQMLTQRRWHARQKLNKSQARKLFRRRDFFHQKLRDLVLDALRSQKLDVHPDVLSSFLVRIEHGGFTSPVN